MTLFSFCELTRELLLLLLFFCEDEVDGIVFAGRVCSKFCNNDRARDSAVAFVYSDISNKKLLSFYS